MMKLFHLWVDLETTPLLGLATTLFVYRFAVAISRWTGTHPLASPLLISIVVLACLLLATGTPCAAYF